MANRKGRQALGRGLGALISSPPQRAESPAPDVQPEAESELGASINGGKSDIGKAQLLDTGIPMGTWTKS